MIVFDIEDTFGIEIPYNANEEVDDFKTVGSVVDRVKASDGEGPAAAAPRPDGERPEATEADSRAPARLCRLAVTASRRLSAAQPAGMSMANANGARRVVVTGMGVVTPIGLTVAEFWASMKAGKCGVTALGGFPLEDLKILIAAQIKDFDPKARLKHFKRDKIIMHADRYSWFAAAAADEAVKQSGLEVPFANPYRSACIIGSGAGGLVTFENSYRDLFIHSKRATHPLTLLRIIGSSASAHVGIEFGVKGPTFATCSACSTATHAIGIARDYIRNGLVDVAIAGASESVINYGTMKAWQALHVLSPEGCFPFAKKRNGTVLGEGAGILVLESLEHAKARGAKILAELVGYGMTSDSQGHGQPRHRGAERGHAPRARGCQACRRPTSTI